MWKWDKAFATNSDPVIEAANFALCDTMNLAGSNYIFSSQYADQLYSDSTGWSCVDPTISPTFGPDGCIPICQKVTYKPGCPDGCDEVEIADPTVPDKKTTICIIMCMNMS